MKVMFVVDHVSGGAGNVIQLLSMAFRDHGDEAVIIFKDGITVQSRYDLSGIQLIDFPAEHTQLHYKHRISLAAGNIKGLRQEIKNGAPDVVISFINNINTICCFAMLGIKIPLIVSERINTLSCSPSGIWKILRQLAYARANKIVVQCNVFQHFCHDWYLNKTVTIPNPVLEPGIRHKIQDKDVYTIISAGRLADQKNFPLLIRSFAIVHSHLPNTRLRIIGEGEERRKLENLVKDMGLEECVSLPGYTTQVYRELADADIYVMTSKDEGFPNSLSEAMAVGLPTVSYLCNEGIRDLVTDGENGILVEQGTPEAMAKAILSVLTSPDLRRKLSVNSRRIVETFSRENVYHMWRNIINAR